MPLSVWQNFQNILAVFELVIEILRFYELIEYNCFGRIEIRENSTQSCIFNGVKEKKLRIFENSVL